MESERDRKVKEITNLAAELSFWNKIKVDTSEQSGKPTLKEFPTSPYVYHFHPITFVEQMKRGDTKKKGNCFCDRDITVEELKTIVKNIRDNTYYENKTITSYHREKLFYLYAKVPVSDQTFEKFAEVLNKAFKNHGITKCSHKIHFLANMYVETMYFTATREGGKDLRYDPYRGRGFQHLTWKTNYEEYEKATGVKIVTDYEKVADDLGIAADTGAWYWKKVKANEYAEKDSIFDTSRLINLPSAKSSSSINGFKNREIAWKELKKIFKYPQQCSNVKQPTTGSENIYDIYSAS